MRRPCSRMAAKCAPRAMNVTLTPAAASRPPKYPPTPPLPTIAILMARILYTLSPRPSAVRLTADTTYRHASYGWSRLQPDRHASHFQSRTDNDDQNARSRRRDHTHVADQAGSLAVSGGRIIRGTAGEFVRRAHHAA